jgi:hypothetical protein
MPAACRRRNARQLVRGPPRRGGKAVGAQNPADRAGRHPPTEPQQLAVDPLVAPPRILVGKPHDQPLHLVGDRRPSLVGGRVGPASGHHAPVPAQQRLGLHHEHRPPRTWEQAAQRRKQRAVGGLQAGPWLLAAQHRELVAQYQDLDLVGLCRPEAEQHQLEAAVQRQLDE